MSFWNRDLMPRSAGQRKKLSLRDWLLLVPVFVLSWGVTFLLYRLTGHSMPSSIWVASWVGPIATAATGGTWMYPNIVDRDTPWQLLWISGLFLVAGAIALGLQLHAGNRNIFEVLMKGMPKHEGWHWDDQYSWYFVLLLIGYVALLSAGRRWLWLTVDKHRTTESDDEGGRGRIR